MKKILFLLLLLVCISFTIYEIKERISVHDYKHDSRHFFCLSEGRCITMWRTHSGICYIIPGEYSGSECPPLSESYITSPFNKGMDIIWQKPLNNMIVILEDEKKQTIHELPNGIRITNYNLNKQYNDTAFFYFDGNYHHFKKSIDFMNIDIKEEYASGNDTVKNFFAFVGVAVMR